MKCKRAAAQDVARAIQAALLAQTAPAAVTDAFCRSRPGRLGQLAPCLATDFDAIIPRELYALMGWQTSAAA